MNALLETAAPSRAEHLAYALPMIGEEEIAEVVDTLRSGWVTTGPKVKRFERDFAEYVGAPHAIAVNSCTVALHLALAALGVGPGDEVIVPTLTFCATANVVVHLGATPVFADIGPDYLVTPQSIEDSITPRTKVIMPVHYAGQACDMEAIYEIADRHNLAVVEDAAHAAGTIYRGKKIGSDALSADFTNIKRITAFSFYATKNLTTGEGGMITSADEELAHKMQYLSQHGMSRDAWKRYTNAGNWYYEVIAAGYKDNMTDIAAALGIHQLRRLDGFIETRQRYAKMYDEAFSQISEILTPIKHDDRNHVYHLYPIQIEANSLKIDRAEFIEALREMKIGASVHFIPVHLHPFYQRTFGHKRGDLPYSERVYNNILSLPLYPRMTEQDVQDVIRAVRHIITTRRR